MNAVNLLDLDGPGLDELVHSLGERTYRARQLKRWIHRHGAADVDSMTDLARSLRDKLHGRAVIAPPAVISHRTAPDATQKWLLSVGGKDAVEAVYIPESDRATLCISTQAGCAVNASPGARAYYDSFRAQKIGHNDALRRVANRLVGIQHGCLKTRTLYNEETAWSHRENPATA